MIYLYFGYLLFYSKFYVNFHNTFVQFNHYNKINLIEAKNLVCFIRIQMTHKNCIYYVLLHTHYEGTKLKNELIQFTW